MADSFNGFQNLSPLLKESYDAHEKVGKDSQAYSKRLGKLMEKPNSSKKYFAHIKRYLKKASR